MAQVTVKKDELCDEEAADSVSQMVDCTDCHATGKVDCPCDDFWCKDKVECKDCKGYCAVEDK